jgi:hypothetical protein
MATYLTTIHHRVILKQVLMFAHQLLIDDGWFYPSGYKFNFVFDEHIS